MSLIIDDPRIEAMVDQIALATGESRVEALRHALEAQCQSLRPKQESRTATLRRYLEQEVWPNLPSDIRGKGLSKSEREKILGYGPEGV